jgi:hypothetical protein
VDLLAHMRQAVSGYWSAMAPHRYLTCSHPPAVATDRSAWERQPVLTGDTAPGTTEPVTDRERAVAAAFVACHPGAAALMTSTYAQLGGRFTHIPAVLRRIAEAGFGGVDVGDFLDMLQLRQLAARLDERPRR